VLHNKIAGGNEDERESVKKCEIQFLSDDINSIA
jgi:hypothetical protein